MSSLISTINPTLPISELIKVIKHSFRECEFNEVEKILIGREKNMKIEMKNLERDRDSLRRKCEELEGKITKSIDREKRAEERYGKKIKELKNKNSENERLVMGVYQEKFQCWDENKKLKGELTELKKQLSSSAAEKLDGQLIKALSQAIDQARMEGYTRAHQQVYVNFPKTENFDDKSVEELRLERLELDKVAGVNEMTFEIKKQSGSKGLKGSEKIMVKNLMKEGKKKKKEEAIKGPKRRQENSIQTSSRRVVEELD